MDGTLHPSATGWAEFNASLWRLSPWTPGGYEE